LPQLVFCYMLQPSILSAYNNRKTIIRNRKNGISYTVFLCSFLLFCFNRTRGIIYIDFTLCKSAETAPCTRDANGCFYVGMLLCIFLCYGLHDGKYRRRSIHRYSSLYRGVCVRMKRYCDTSQQQNCHACKSCFHNRLPLKWLQ